MSQCSSSSTPTVHADVEVSWHAKAPTGQTSGNTLPWTLSQCSFRNSFGYSLDSPKSILSVSSFGNDQASNQNIQPQLLNLYGNEKPADQSTNENIKITKEVPASPSDTFALPALDPIFDSNLNESLVVHHSCDIYEPEYPKFDMLSEARHSNASQRSQYSHTSQKSRLYRSKRAASARQSKLCTPTTSICSESDKTQNASKSISVMSNENALHALMRQSLLKPSTLFYKSSLSTVPRSSFAFGEANKRSILTAAGSARSTTSARPRAPSSSHTCASNETPLSNNFDHSTRRIVSCKMIELSQINPLDEILDIEANCGASSCRSCDSSECDSVIFGAGQLDFSVHAQLHMKDISSNSVAIDKNDDWRDMASESVSEIVDYLVYEDEDDMSEDPPHNTPAFEPIRMPHPSLQSKESSAAPSELMPSEWILV